VSEDAIPAVTVLPAAERLRLLGYAGLLLLLINLAAPSGGLIGFPVFFFLKNRLHLGATAFAQFNLWLGIPLYLSFLFGFLRDRWSPFGTGDRGHLVLFGGACAALYAGLAFVHPTYSLLLGGLLAVTATSLIAGSAATGIFTAMGQEHVMTGQASAVANVASMTPTFIGTLLGGWLSQALEGARADDAARALFLTGAGLMAALAVFGGLGPRRIFTHHAPVAAPSLLSEAGRLLRHGPVYPAFFILLFWNFAPALGTVMQYHLVNSLHATDSQVGVFYTIYWASNIPTVLLYGWVCQRAPLSRLLVWAALIAVPQMLPLLWVHTPTQAFVAAVPIGLVGGFAYAAFIDLAIRSSPVGLQATMMMLVITTTFFVAGRFGDLWGTILYEHAGGFATTVWATVLIYALILPVLYVVPRRLTASADGQALS
jgi:hypothetical protein